MRVWRQHDNTKRSETTSDYVFNDKTACAYRKAGGVEQKNNTDPFLSPLRGKTGIFVLGLCKVRMCAESARAVVSASSESASSAVCCCLLLWHKRQTSDSVGQKCCTSLNKSVRDAFLCCLLDVAKAEMHYRLHTKCQNHFLKTKQHSFGIVKPNWKCSDSQSRCAHFSHTSLYACCVCLHCLLK